MPSNERIVRTGKKVRLIITLLTSSHNFNAPQLRYPIKYYKKEMICQVAVVTGSNRGIGLAIAEGLADAWDGDIFITSRDEKKGKEVCFAFVDMGSINRLLMLSIKIIILNEKYIILGSRDTSWIHGNVWT